jgi:hopene-associated glycosyltransferase HpnB
LAIALGIVTLLIWIGLMAGRGGFWLARERDDAPLTAAEWPAVTAVVPARNEAAVIADSIGSLLRQDYPGSFTLVLVDDDSGDGTAARALETSARMDTPHRLSVIAAGALPQGWTGKLWAMRQGIAYAEPDAPHYLLLTDADIAHAPDTLRWLVAQARSRDYGLVSLMAKLRCDSLVERIHVPAFILFFQMLYPFAWVNRPDSRTAAAAGGCMLVNAETLRRAGGIAAIRGALIDDCALGRAMKQHGPVWLGLTDRVRSIRPYESWSDVRGMVTRSAYAQLRYSPLLLLGTILGMILTYLVPVLLAIFAEGTARMLGIAGWLLMAVAFQPTLRFYRLSPLWGLALPAIAALYTGYTVLSAFDYARGRGGLWKGRVQANVSRG